MRVRRRRVSQLLADRQLDSLRKDARWKALLKKVTCRREALADQDAARESAVGTAEGRRQSMAHGRQYPSLMHGGSQSTSVRDPDREPAIGNADHAALAADERFHHHHHDRHHDDQIATSSINTLPPGDASAPNVPLKEHYGV